MSYKLLKKYIVLGFTIIASISSMKAQESAPVGDTLRLSLDNALALALDQSPTMKIADLELQRIDYSNKETWGKLLPSMTGSFQYTNNVMKPVMFMPESFSVMMGGQRFMEIGYKNSLTAGLSAGLPIINFALWENLKSKQLETDLVLEKARSSRLEMKQSVKDAYYKLLMATYSAQVLQNTYDNANKTLKHTEVAYEQGAVSEYDLIRARVQVGNLKPNVITAKYGIELAAMQLKILLGLDLNTPIVLTERWEQFEDQLFSADLLPSPSLSGNTNLRQMDLNIRQSQSKLKLIKTQYFPTLNAFGQVGYQTQSDDFKISEFQWVSSASVGLQLSLPILSGLTRHHQYKQMEIGLKEMEYQRTLMEDNLTVAMKAALSNMKAAKEQISAAKNAVNQAQRGADIANKRYEIGAGTILELNDSEMALLQAKLNYTQAIYNYMSAKNNYETLITNE